MHSCSSWNAAWLGLSSSCTACCLQDTTAVATEGGAACQRQSEACSGQRNNGIPPDNELQIVQVVPAHRTRLRQLGLREQRSCDGTCDSLPYLHRLMHVWGGGRALAGKPVRMYVLRQQVNPPQRCAAVTPTTHPCARMSCCTACLIAADGLGWLDCSGCL